MPTKKPEQSYEEFVFHISEPALSYHFGIEHDRRFREEHPFKESLTMEMKSECLCPDRFSGRVGTISIYAEPDLETPKALPREDRRRQWIGYTRATKGQFETAIWLPPRALTQLPLAIASGLFTSMLTNSMVEPRGMFRLRSVSFRGVDFDAVEYVG